nr:hypothetical protein Itr_chr10CG07860 [Ipomoea trifida]
MSCSPKMESISSSKGELKMLKMSSQGFKNCSNPGSKYAFQALSAGSIISIAADEASTTGRGGANSISGTCGSTSSTTTSSSSSIFGNSGFDRLFMASSSARSCFPPAFS